MAVLSMCPSYAKKEILLLFSAMNTCDPGNVFDSVKKLKK